MNKRKKKKIWNRMTCVIGSVLKQDPNIKMFKPKQVFFCLFSSFLTVYLLFKSRFVAWQRGFPRNVCILCVRVKINKRSFELFCVWILLCMTNIARYHRAANVSVHCRSHLHYSCIPVICIIVMIYMVIVTYISVITCNIVIIYIGVVAYIL